MIKLVVIVSAVIGLPPSLITVGWFFYGPWGLLDFRDDSPEPKTTSLEAPGDLNMRAGLSLPTATKVPTPVHILYPTPALSLYEMMDAGETGTTDAAQDQSMREVAETALNFGDYKKAIEAGTRSGTIQGEAATLTFVARRAVKHGEFGHALDAATAITLDASLDHASRTPSIASLIEVFAGLGYEACEDAGIEPGCRKVALYADPQGDWTHAAVQLCPAVAGAANSASTKTSATAH